MKLPERFERAYQALITAFFDETLAKGVCTACAVGNIVAAGYGEKVLSTTHHLVGKQFHCNARNSEWSDIFYTSDGLQKFDNFAIIKNLEAAINIVVTGYSVEELAKIEFAFEINTKLNLEIYQFKSKKEIMEDQFTGLMAVVDVLCEIEGLNSTEYKKSFEFNEALEPVNI